ncbi:MAG: hypothetical protein WCA27_17375 [Candidatus Sulfotelmatobacter sp.]
MDADQKRNTKIQLNKLSAQLAIAAKKSQRKIDVATLVSLGQSVAGFSDSADREISQLAWRVTLQIINYRSFLNADHSPLGHESFVTNSEVSMNRFLLHLTYKPPVGVSWSPEYVPIDQAFIYKKIGDTRPPSGHAHLLVSGAAESSEVMIDGYHLKNVIFNHLKIRYAGGPLIMENVYFVNCTFVDLQPTHSGELFANAVLEQVPVNFTTS